MDAALITVMQIHLTEPEGDALLFLTGQEEIDTAAQVRLCCPTCCIVLRSKAGHIALQPCRLWHAAGFVPHSACARHSHCCRHMLFLQWQLSHLQARR